MKENKFPFSEEFKEWYLNLHNNEDSAKSYLSYLNSIYYKVCPNLSINVDGQIFNGQEIIDNYPFLLFKNKDSKNFAIKFLKEIGSKIPNYISTYKTKSNYNSAINKYQIFLLLEIIKNKGGSTSKDSKNFPKINEKIAKNMLSQLGNKEMIYDHNDLMDIFKSRFKSQDRKGQGYALPMKKLTTEKILPGINDWIPNFLNKNVKFITGVQNGNIISTVNFEDVVCIQIINKKIVLKTKNNSYKIYTEIAQGKYELIDKYLNKFEAAIIGELDLDHDIPIVDILRNSANPIFNINIDQNILWKNFENIHNQVKFTVMIGEQNSRKGNRYNSHIPNPLPNKK